MTSYETTVVSVSRDALRADLAEMELRLRSFFDEQLKQKADRATVLEHAAILDRLNRGEFGLAQTNAIETIVVDTMNERTDRGWTSRERYFGVIAILITVGSFLLTLAAATNHLN